MLAHGLMKHLKVSLKHIKLLTMSWNGTNV